jgi:hypothetical protein
MDGLHGQPVMAMDVKISPDSLTSVVTGSGDDLIQELDITSNTFTTSSTSSGEILDPNTSNESLNTDVSPNINCSAVIKSTTRLPRPGI